MKKGRTEYIGFRVPRRDKQLLVKVCESRGEDLSDFARRAIRAELAKLSYLGDAEKKALGVKNG
jgi:uncharacterized protein (DUF1778 family)